MNEWFHCPEKDCPQQIVPDGDILRFLGAIRQHLLLNHGGMRWRDLERSLIEAVCANYPEGTTVG